MSKLHKFQTMLSLEKTERRLMGGMFMTYKEARRQYHRAARRDSKREIREQLLEID